MRGRVPEGARLQVGRAPSAIWMAVSGTLFAALGLASVWGTAAIGWVAAFRVSRRDGAGYLEVLLDRRAWMGERICGVPAGPLMMTWLVLGIVVTFVAAFWRP